MRKRSVRVLPTRVPVMSGPRCIELADAARVKHLAKAPNVELIRRRRDGRVVEIHLLEFGDDSRKRARNSNPQAYSHHAETEDNPSNTWTLKRLPRHTRAVFRAVLDGIAA
jgi:hypothetical protein